MDAHRLSIVPWPPKNRYDSDPKGVTPGSRTLEKAKLLFSSVGVIPKEPCSKRPEDLGEGRKVDSARTDVVSNSGSISLHADSSLNKGSSGSQPRGIKRLVKSSKDAGAINLELNRGSLSDNASKSVTLPVIQSPFSSNSSLSQSHTPTARSNFSVYYEKSRFS
ncbi:hypothetical protein NE237_028415 [Protea cynaroides]|uniref:Uncharacterized protein n=1 Tax=Protea cynaroides TaxID=273540 RepID=A0A9Q0GPV0_9MAGN|nr:hypothetical protein NE237_028415 [Protea cynaroides]